MEHSANSSMNKALCSKEGASSCQESGWTTYFEDFLASEKKEVSGCSSSFWGGVSSSVVSDAASCAAWKLSAGPEESKSRKKLSFKKRKARGILDDDSLEDTASSPVNSPKVGDLNHLDMNVRKKDESRDTSQEEKPGDEMNEVGFIERTNDCTELKKRGLRLVPLSMFVDFLG